MHKSFIKLLTFWIPSKKMRKKCRSILMNEPHKDSFDPDSTLLNDINNLNGAVEVKRLETPQLQQEYSIGIVTYNKRFKKFFIPLIQDIRRKYQGDIIVCINGTHNELFDQEYRREILTFLADYDRVYPMFFSDFRSLSKLWNNCLINSPTDNLLLLNDDLTIRDNFWSELHSAIIQNDYKSFMMNKTFSNVFLSRQEINQVGWFDERLLGVSAEDSDMQIRWLKTFGYHLPHILNVKGIDDIHDDQDTMINQKKSSKYSMFDQILFQKKYTIHFKKDGKDKVKVVYDQNIADSPQYPYEQFYWEHKQEL